LRGRQLGVQVTRQYPIGNAIVDFACRQLRLAIELDGGQHADNPADEERTRIIDAYGYRVIRFWNIDVLQNTDGVIQRLIEEIAIARNESPPP
jgi:very-short-patch-repair endonuclease